MKNKIVCIVSCGVCFTLLGCASEQRRVTGFIGDYTVLKPHPSIQGALVYWNPGIDPKKYNAVMIEPVDVHFAKQTDKNSARPYDLARFRKYVTNELTAAISKHATIATEPGPNVLRCRLQVANLRLTRQIGEPLYHWLPPDYALGSASIETEARDSMSGELVVAYVSPPGSVEIYTPRLLTSPPDLWESVSTAVRSHVVSIGDAYGRRVMNRSDVYVAYYYE